jgi:hypothetical protein
MIKIYFFIVFISAVVFLNCTKKPDPTPTATSPPKTATEKKNKTIFESLSGKWQSVDDKKNSIEFKEHSYSEYYDGKIIEENKFLLDKACPGEEGSGSSGDNEKYLVVGDMCWYIIKVDEDNLELSYTARGNTLIYKKIK